MNKELTVYCASPFFNPEQIRIRDAMEKKYREKFNPEIVFRPDLTENSKKYDADPSIETAKLIFKDNVDNILSNETLMFPMKTNDIGTLFEVGVAIKTKRQIWAYDPDKDEGHFIVQSQIEDLDMTDFIRPTLIQIETLSSAVLLGYNFNCGQDIYYVLGKGVDDNLMLRMMATRVEFDPDYKNFKLKSFDIAEAK